MADPFYGEIRMFCFNYAPQNWAYCNGSQILAAQNQALFAIIGTTFGGNSSVFNLPNLQGVMPMQVSNDSGLSPHNWGQSGGTNAVTLSMAQIPGHNHTVKTGTGASDTTTPGGNTYMGLSIGTSVYKVTPPSCSIKMSSLSLTNAGQASPIAHENRQPYLALNFCICLYGDWPMRPEAM